MRTESFSDEFLSEEWWSTELAKILEGDDNLGSAKESQEAKPSDEEDLLGFRILRGNSKMMILVGSFIAGNLIWQQSQSGTVGSQTPTGRIFEQLFAFEFTEWYKELPSTSDFVSEQTYLVYKILNSYLEIKPWENRQQSISFWNYWRQTINQDQTVGGMVTYRRWKDLVSTGTGNGVPIQVIILEYILKKRTKSWAKSSIRRRSSEDSKGHR
jgi:hypothetical protein